MVLESSVNNLAEVINYNASSDTKIKRVSGFKDTDQDYLPYRGFSSWTGNNTVDNEQLHSIALPIPILTKGQETRLQYSLQIFAHYKELPDPELPASHQILFRIPAICENTALEFLIPKGLISEVFMLTVEGQKGYSALASTKLNSIEDQIFSLDNGFGQGFIKQEENDIRITWQIHRRTEAMTKFKVTWFTKRPAK